MGGGGFRWFGQCPIERKRFFSIEAFPYAHCALHTDWPGYVLESQKLSLAQSCILLDRYTIIQYMSIMSRIMTRWTWTGQRSQSINHQSIIQSNATESSCVTVSNYLLTTCGVSAMCALCTHSACFPKQKLLDSADKVVNFETWPHHKIRWVDFCWADSPKNQSRES